MHTAADRFIRNGQWFLSAREASRGPGHPGHPFVASRPLVVVGALRREAAVGEMRRPRGGAEAADRSSASAERQG
ncbi:hypothetical protein GCM10020216_084740 [Nonomuraea helvata]